MHYTPILVTIKTNSAVKNNSPIHHHDSLLAEIVTQSYISLISILK